MIFDSKQFKPSEGSHLPVLMKLVSMTDGSILELGTGFNSTPFLHWMCNGTRRKLVSYESNPSFWELAKNYQKDFHEVNFIDDWDKIDTSDHWSIIFIDHAPGTRRNVEMARLANSGDYVVVHDTEAKSDWHYNYSKSFPLYKYRFDYKLAYPETSVLSNFIDLKDFKV
jgi:predicted O-methyltransferase YrrM